MRPDISRAERGLDLGLALGVEGAGGFVEQQDRRVFQEGAGDGDALALTAGKGARRPRRPGCRSPRERLG